MKKFQNSKTFKKESSKITKNKQQITINPALPSLSLSIHLCPDVYLSPQLRAHTNTQNFLHSKFFLFLSFLFFSFSRSILCFFCFSHSFPPHFFNLSLLFTPHSLPLSFFFLCFLLSSLKLSSSLFFSLPGLSNSSHPFFFIITLLSLFSLLLFPFFPHLPISKPFLFLLNLLSHSLRQSVRIPLSLIHI